MAERKPDAMDCWHFIAPLIPLSDDFSMTVYVKTFHAFKLLEEEEKRKKGQIRRRTMELKPCPCGGKVRCVSIPFTHDKYMVMCFNEGCGNSQDKWYDTKEEAIEAWNRRAVENELI